MAITAKLNAAWATNNTVDAVFEVRALLQSLSNEATRVKAAVDAITADASFAGVDSELKTEGAAIIGVVGQLVTAFASHSDFLDWTQP